MELLKTCSLVAIAVVLLLCISTEAYPGQPSERRHYKVEDAEAAASDWDHDHDDRNRRHHHHHNDGGITGPIHTFVKTDKHANFKWGVRHHVGQKYT